MDIRFIAGTAEGLGGDHTLAVGALRRQSARAEGMTA